MNWESLLTKQYKGTNFWDIGGFFKHLDFEKDKGKIQI